MTWEPYDFRKPGRLPDEVDRRLGSWLRRFCALAAERWTRHLPFAVALEFQGLSVRHVESALEELSESAVGYRVRLAPSEATALLVMPRTCMLLLLAGLLGDAGTALPQDRELTVVEDALADYGLRNLFLPVLDEAWPGPAPIRLEPREQESAPRYTRLFPLDGQLVAGTLILRGPFGEQIMHWLLPMKGWLEPAARTSTGAGPTRAGRSATEPVVRELPVEVTVRLGQVRLPLSQVSQLRAGDLLVLDQLTSEPLTACVAGTPMFTVWPGRAGARQAVAIASIQE